MAFAIVLLSALAATLELSAVHPGTGKPVSLLTIAGLRRIMTEMVTNFTSFAPLGTVPVAMLHGQRIGEVGHHGAGLGTLVATMLPYSVTFLVGWTMLLIAWVLMGCLWDRVRLCTSATARRHPERPNASQIDTMTCMARIRLAMLVGCCLWSTPQLAQSQYAPTKPPTAVVAELDGIIHPIAAEYIDEVITEADTSGADVVVIVLRTPGGLLDSTRDIVSRIIASRAPVVVFVGPAGARAASAGFVITEAADVAVMAPGTHIGAAHPVSGTGPSTDTVAATKAAEDVAAYVRSLAEARGRNVELSGEAVMKSRAFTDREAISASPPLIDLVADDVPALLRSLDGRTVRRFDGRTTILRTAGAEIRTVEMSRRQRFLSAIAHPQIAYILLTLGILGLTVEFWNPGTIAPGVAGAVCLLLAFFALQILPVNTTGVLLVLFGVVLLLLELKVPSFGALGIGGAVSLVMGSVMMTRSVPGVAVPLHVVLPIALSFAGILLFLGRLGLQAQQLQPVTGADALIGTTGRTRMPITPGGRGQIDLRGEIWTAESAVLIEGDQPVRVLAVNGLTLLVEPAGAPTRQGENRWTD